MVQSQLCIPVTYYYTAEMDRCSLKPVYGISVTGSFEHIYRYRKTWPVYANATGIGKNMTGIGKHWSICDGRNMQFFRKCPEDSQTSFWTPDRSIAHTFCALESAACSRLSGMVTACRNVRRRVEVRETNLFHGTPSQCAKKAFPLQQIQINR